MMKSEKIIISGPPSSGKTSIINSLLKKGYNCFQEINPTKIKTTKIKNDKFLLSEYLFQTRLEEYTKSIDQLTFFDRSIIDVIAYLKLWEIQYPESWDEIILENRYHNKVFYTPIWEEIYEKTDIRLESFKESLLIDDTLRKSYLGYKYNIIDVPKSDIENRVQFIIKNI